VNVYFEGKPYDMPDDMTDEELVREFNARKMAKGGYLQGLASSMMGLGSLLKRDQANQPPPTTAPNIPQGAMGGLGLEGTLAVLNQQAQVNQNDAQNRMRFQENVTREIEAEKDRTQALKLLNLRHQNDVALQGLETKRQEHLAELRAKTPKVGEMGSDTAGRGVYVFDPVGGMTTYHQIMEPVKPGPKAVGAGQILINPETGEQIFTGPAVQPGIKAIEARTKLNTAQERKVLQEAPVQPWRDYRDPNTGRTARVYLDANNNPIPGTEHWPRTGQSQPIDREKAARIATYKTNMQQAQQVLKNTSIRKSSEEKAAWANFYNKNLAALNAETGVDISAESEQPARSKIVVKDGVEYEVTP